MKLTFDFSNKQTMKVLIPLELLKESENETTEGEPQPEGPPRRSQ